MAEFLDSEQINSRLIQMIKEANEFLCFISPYIKLHDRIKDALKLKMKNHEMKLVIVFGKNEDDASKSLSKEDFEFLKQFPNVKICYEKNLHAKYYTSEGVSILTSMNLHQFSQNNNIEAGILMYPKGALKMLASVVSEQEDLDKDAWRYFNDVITNSKAIYEKEPEYESKMFGLQKIYARSKINIDKSDEFFGGAIAHFTNKTTLNTFANAQTSSQSNESSWGYCIRTGERIAFNLKMPMTEKAFRSWNNFGDEYYPERYCHYSGEPSNGETCFAKPVLRKYWNKVSH